MAINLQTAKAAAAARGLTAPADYPGGADAWALDWFQNGVNAGDPDLQQRAGTQKGERKAEEGGVIHDFSSSAASSEWLGKRKPTVQELRKWAKETNRSEDYERFPDTAVSGWIDRHWDVGAGSFKNNYGDLVDKPDERGANTPAGFNGTGDRGGWDMPGQGGGGAGGGGGRAAAPAAPGPPPPPTTFGSQLGYTGNPLTDMLLQQFNSGTQLSDPSKMNMFALGGDRQEGGEGGAADAQTRTGQLLQGGGLWWQEGGTPASPDKSAFGGFRADTKNANAANPLSLGATPPATPAAPTGGSPSVGGSPAAAKAGGGAPTPAQIAAPPTAMGLSSPSAMGTPVPPAMTPMAGMLDTNYRPRETWRKQAGGTDNPMSF